MREVALTEKDFFQRVRMISVVAVMMMMMMMMLMMMMMAVVVVMDGGEVTTRGTRSRCLPELEQVRLPPGRGGP